jgi:hypothetical protein
MRWLMSVVGVVVLFLAGCGAGTTSDSLPTAPSMTASSALASSTTEIDREVATAGDPAVGRGLGLACSPDDCAVGRVATASMADHRYQGEKGVLGFLWEAAVINEERFVEWWGIPVTTDTAVVAGVLENVETEVDAGGHPGLVGTFYFGDHPTTGSAVVGRVYLGPTDDEIDATLSWYCNEVGGRYATEDGLVLLDHDTQSAGCNYVDESGAWGGGTQFVSFEEGELVAYLEIDHAYVLSVMTDVTTYFAGMNQETRDECSAEAECRFPMANADAVDRYTEALLDQMRGEATDLPAGGLTVGSLHLYSPLGDPGVTVIVYPECSACDEFINALEQTSPRPPIHVLVIDQTITDADAMRLWIDTNDRFPMVRVHARDGTLYSERWTGATPATAEGVVSFACGRDVDLADICSGLPTTSAPTTTAASATTVPPTTIAVPATTAAP